MERFPAWITLAILAAIYFLYLFRLTGTGLLKEDEPRYASIAREMARSGDWITPRLWGHPWFEKPPLLYWMTAASIRIGIPEDLGPRLPIAILSILFLAFFFSLLRREFGGRAACFSTAILATSAGWLAYSYVAVTDLPLSVFFSTAMLLGMLWLRTGTERWLITAAIALGLAVLAKSLVPLALSIPFAWSARSKWRELLNWKAIACFLIIAAPWYLLCYSRNGHSFVQTLFWEQQVGRLDAKALGHGQPFWYYLPAFLGALFPWTPTLGLWRPSSDSRRIFLMQWVVFGLLFFSIFPNKLPGYILPLLPATAALTGLALDEARGAARWALAITAALLCVVFPLAAILPRALAEGLSHANFPTWSYLWALPIGLAALVWHFDAREKRTAAVSLVAIAFTAAVIYLKLVSFPTIDSTVSARSLWREIAPIRDRVCVANLDRSWRYGLNYYSVIPLPDCEETPRPLKISQSEGAPPSVK